MNPNTDILNGYITLEKLSAELDRSKRSLHRLHVNGKGPKRIKVGRLIIYKVEDVKKWLESNTQFAPEPVRPPLNIRKAILGKKLALTRAKGH